MMSFRVSSCLNRKLQSGNFKALKANNGGALKANVSPCLRLSWIVSENKMAEREGFEPSIRYNRIPDFESGAFDHSATFP